MRPLRMLHVESHRARNGHHINRIRNLRNTDDYPLRDAVKLIKYFPDGSDVSIEVGDDRAAASNSRFETVEWDIEDGIPQKLVDMLHPKAG